MARRNRPERRLILPDSRYSNIQVQMLINQARELAASPYSHLIQASQTLTDIADLARSVKGVATSVADLEDQFEDLYPTAVAGLDPRTALQQALARTDTARETAQDLANYVEQRVLLNRQYPELKDTRKAWPAIQQSLPQEERPVYRR